jgi:outer membrane protein OmpA-like peptidoglycan-associated protein
MTPPAQPVMAQPAMAEPSAAQPEPAAAAQSSAQDQPAAGEFSIEPESFEFDPELDEYQSEWDQLEVPRTLPAPPVDKNPVSGCITPGRPFDDFEFRSSAVPATHGPRIKELAKIIVNSWVTDPSLGIRTVCLEGHTDNVGPTDVNMRLGLARAKNLRAKLKQAIFDEAKKTGFGQQITDSVTILVSSQGKANPVAPNTTALGRRRNRRVRFAFST